MSDPIIAEFTLQDGKPVAVNLAMVTHWAPDDDDGTVISFSDDQSVLVMESFDAVSEMLNPERQAGQ